jgi:hypothetical protein
MFQALLAHIAGARSFYNIDHRLVALVDLNLSNASYGTTDQVLQEVSKCLKKLRTLQVHTMYTINLKPILRSRVTTPALKFSNFQRN